MGTMIDDELHPRRVRQTAPQKAARREANEKKLGVKLAASPKDRVFKGDAVSKRFK